MTNSQVFGGMGEDVYEHTLFILFTITFHIILIDSGDYKPAINFTHFLLVIGLH